MSIPLAAPGTLPLALRLPLKALRASRSYSLVLRVTGVEGEARTLRLALRT